MSLVDVNALSGLRVLDAWCVVYLRVGELVLFVTHSPTIVLFLWVNLMSVPSPTSPLSLSSSSDGSIDVQDGFPSASHSPQPGVPSVLDGCRSDHLSQSPHRQLLTYSDILKLGVGSDGSPNVPSSESQLYPNLRECQPSGVLSVGCGECSGLPRQPKTRPPIAPQSASPIPSDELLACCPLGRIWGNLSCCRLSYIAPIMTGVLSRGMWSM